MNSTESTGHAPRFVVACLCAEWCSSCREYRPTFEDVARRLPGVQFRWVDVEDEAALVDDLELADFPTVFIASDAGPRFFGSLTPQPEILVRLVRSFLADPGGAALTDPALRKLLARLRALPGSLPGLGKME